MFYTYHIIPYIPHMKTDGCSFDGNCFSLLRERVGRVFACVCATQCSAELLQRLGARSMPVLESCLVWPFGHEEWVVLFASCWEKISLVHSLRSLQCRFGGSIYVLKKY